MPGQCGGSRILRVEFTNATGRLYFPLRFRRVGYVLVSDADAAILGLAFIGTRLFGLRYFGSLRIASPSRLVVRSSEPACGVLAASVLGFKFWWPDDPTAGPWVPIVVTVTFVGALLIAVFGGALGHRRQNGHACLSRWQAYTTIAAVTVACSGAIAGNGLLVTHKIHTDRMVAEERVRSLYEAAARTVADYGDVSSAQDGIKVEGHYRGPAFNDSEWQGLTRNLMRRNGYVYQIYLAQPPAGGVLVYALPIEYEDRVKVGLCLDGSGRLRCPLIVRRDQACIPCEGEKK
jgi:hypothetical protein